MDEIAPGIWRWTARHPQWHTRIEWGHEVASYALIGDGLVLVDPLLPATGAPGRAEVDRALERLAREASRLDITITIPYHARSAEELFLRYRDALPTAIWGHRAVARRFTDDATVLSEIEPGGPVGEVATALPIGKPRRYETPLYFPAHRALAFGDAVIGIDGGLRIWQEASTDPLWHERVFVPTMRPLLDLDVERVLVTHGPAVLHDGRRALADAMAAGAWDYRTLKV
ncbi:MAG TPA: hypothetical protein VL117_14310 [Thermoleophilia bacterium]|nr:hypothetical protein [Thermoleophilia bacterium]